MHPAPSIILFTVASGAGYGLLFLLGLGAPLGLLPFGPWLGFIGLGLALGLITLGLMSSLLHLGRPDRAWRALSQWRSSWLSREGVMALITYVPAGLFGIGWVFLGGPHGIWGAFGLLAAAGAAVTVACTGMIYASLKPIRQWHNPWVVPVYLAFSLMTGALWLIAVMRMLGQVPPWAGVVAMLALALGWGVKLGYWRAVDAEPARSTAESATGLGDLGRVRLLDPPHTEENYLMREMGFGVARKHAAKLRRLALLIGLGAPFLLTALALGQPGSMGTLAALAAAVLGSLGAAMERWLFFAEATHTVMLYYGRSEA